MKKTTFRKKLILPFINLPQTIIVCYVVLYITFLTIITLEMTKPYPTNWEAEQSCFYIFIDFKDTPVMTRNVLIQSAPRAIVTSC